MIKAKVSGRLPMPWLSLFYYSIVISALAVDCRYGMRIKMWVKLYFFAFLSKIYTLTPVFDLFSYLDDFINIIRFKN